MELEKLKNEALQMAAHERADLAATLKDSLDDLTEPEWLALWARETERRDAELEAAETPGRDADDVFRQARARLK